MNLKLVSLSFASCVLAFNLFAAEQAKSEKLNVLFLFADDQRADTIAALGNPVIKTPNLDRLVRSGLSFNRAYMQGSDAMLYLYDVLPTLGGMCGVPPPPKSDGINFSAVLRDPSRSGRSEMVFAYKDVQRAIATPDWKLIRYPQVNQTQLFNLQADPYEIHNLAADPKQASRVAELSSLLKQKLLVAGDNPNGRRGGKNEDKDGVP
jgi:arylsulfatase A-like enzyme